ncbi:MAG: Ig-like domain-containing protein [Gemmatimonadota bacterium]
MTRLRSALLLVTLAVTAACGSDNGTGTTVVGPPTLVLITTTPSPTVGAGGSAGTFTVRVSDVKGNPVSGVGVTFSATGSASVGTQFGTSDASGNASTSVTAGTVAGAATVRAAATGVATAATANITVIAAAAAKVAVTPKTLRFVAVSDTARVTATAEDQFGNVAAPNAISYSATDATLVSVDQAGLVRVLRLGGTTFVISSSAGKADTTVVTVLPAGSTLCTGLATSTPMNVGDIQTYSGKTNVCAPGTAAGAEFTLVTFNSSIDQSILATTSVVANGIGAPPSTDAQPVSMGALAIRDAISAAATAARMPDQSFHLRQMEEFQQRYKGALARERAARRSMVSRSVTGSGAMSLSASAIPANAKVGDFLNLNVSANSCTGAVNHGLRVEAIGTKSIVLSDTLNPADGFTTANYQRFAATFDTLVYPLDAGAFGAPSDIDANGRVAIIFTRIVNEMVTSQSGYFVGGFFNPRDLLPRVAAVTADNCPGSNEGEMFYMVVPAPGAGINGVTHTVGFVDSLTMGIIAHEFQHLINFSRRSFVNTTATDYEEVWLNEGLSHIAEELLYYRESGLSPRLNLNDNDIRIVNRPTYGFWKGDAASNFSRFLSYLRAPSVNSPIANGDDLATRGATWSFLRYAADRLGTTDGTMWQRFDNSTVTGMATLQLVFGTDPIPLFRDWTVANYLDDFLPTVDPRYQHKSWNYRDIFTTTFLNIPMYPLVVGNLADNLKTDLMIRGGSAAYLRFSVPPGRESLLTLTSGGGTPSTPLQFMLVRTK